MTDLSRPIEDERDDAYSAFIGHDVKEVRHMIPWKRIGNYLHQHPQAARWTEAVLYASLCLMLYQVGREVLGYDTSPSRCRIPQTENIHGAEPPERFIRLGRETFYSQIDGKEISDLVK